MDLAPRSNAFRQVSYQSTKGVRNRSDTLKAGETNIARKRGSNSILEPATERQGDVVHSRGAVPLRRGGDAPTRLVCTLAERTKQEREQKQSHAMTLEQSKISRPHFNREEIKHHLGLITRKERMR